jgi:hypothetical protein
MASEFFRQTRIDGDFRFLPWVTFLTGKRIFLPCSVNKYGQTSCTDWRRDDSR